MLHIDLRDRRGWLREGLLARITAKLSPYLSCVWFSTTVEDDTPDSDTHNVARSVGFRSFYMIPIEDSLHREMVRTVLNLASWTEGASAHGTH